MARASGVARVNPGTVSHSAATNRLRQAVTSHRTPKLLPSSDSLTMPLRHWPLEPLYPMKTLARIGAVLSFGFFSLPGMALMAHASGDAKSGQIIFGSLFIGIGCFAGTLLWLLGEKFGSKPDAK